jgi:hypothetical protein
MAASQCSRRWKREEEETEWRPPMDDSDIDHAHETQVTRKGFEKANSPPRGRAQRQTQVSPRQSGLPLEVQPGRVDPLFVQIGRAP